MNPRCISHPDRRAFLGAAALGAASVSLLGSPLLAKRTPQRTSIIDVHHHFVVPSSEFGTGISWSPAASVEAMDELGVAAGIGWPGPVLTPDIERAGAVARKWNEFGATVGRDHPGRFGLFATLAMHNVAASIAEVDYALDVLHADGFGIATSFGDKWLGDSAFWPIYEKLNARSAVIFVHPQDASCCAPETMTYSRPQVPGPMIRGAWLEWPVNTARTILSLMTSGTLRCFPRIRFIFSHGGGVMPLLVQRIANFSARSGAQAEYRAAYFPNGIAAEFAALHFECAQAYSSPNFEALRALVPDSRILFGSDSPGFPLAHSVHQFAALKLSTRSRALISRENAVGLLPRWA